MKRMVLITMGLMLLAGSVSAQPFPGLPDTAYVGLFADAAHSVRQVNYTAIPPAYTSFMMYVCWLPSARGITAVEFAMSYPANIIPLAPTKNALVALEMGSFSAGVSTVFSTCITDWIWSHSQRCFLTDATQGEIMVVEHPTLLPPAYQVATCELGAPIEPVKRLTHLYLNYDGGLAVGNKSWGAIKNLF